MSAETRYTEYHSRAVEVVTEYNRLVDTILHLPDDEYMSAHANHLRAKRDGLAYQALGLLSLITGV